jgi:hypothetical protein
MLAKTSLSLSEICQISAEILHQIIQNKLIHFASIRV